MEPECAHTAQHDFRTDTFNPERMTVPMTSFFLQCLVKQRKGVEQSRLLAELTLPSWGASGGKVWDAGITCTKPPQTVH